MTTIRRSSERASSTSITSRSAARARVALAYRSIIRAVEVVVIGLMTALAAVVAAGVFFRYVINNALSWTDEIGGLLLVWITFLGAVVALDREMHLDMELLAGRVHGRARTALRAVTDLALGIFLIVIVVNGWEITTRLMDVTAISVPVPRGLLQIVMPVSGVLMLLVLTVRWALPEATGAARRRAAGTVDVTE